MCIFAASECSITLDMSGMQIGSHGSCVFAMLPYFDTQLSSPLATYHVLYLGPVKDFLGWAMARFCYTGPAHQRPILGIALPGPSWAKAALKARLRHAVLRTRPTCSVVDISQYLSAMTISETQLMLECIVPYLFHDGLDFGVPPDVLVMWCESALSCLVDCHLTFICAWGSE